MILVCGIPSEGPLSRVLRAAIQLGIDAAVFNQRRVHAATLSIGATECTSGLLRLEDRDVSLDEVRGVYTRLIASEDLPENQSDADPSVIDHSARTHGSLDDWFEVARCRVLNRTSAMASNASKPYQAQLIVRGGFRTPETLVTNDPEIVREFARRHERVIYKSISSVRSIVRELTRDASKRLDDIRRLPTQFQELIEGKDVRVHVVGDAVFATEVRTPALDYRYAHRDNFGLEMIATTLPADVEARCVAVSRLLGLPLCGIDLKRTPDGEYVCFEVNPSPAFSYYEDHTDQPIAAAIAAYLETGVASEVAWSKS